MDLYACYNKPNLINLMEVFIINNKITLIFNNHYFTYIIRIISWMTICLYAYLGFSNPEYFEEHSFLTIIFMIALFGTQYKVHYCKTSFFKRFCEILLHLLLVFLMVFAMYVVAIY